MSALTEKVARDHRYYPGLGICECGLDFEPTAPDYYDKRELHTQHVVAVTETAVHAQVLADLKIAALHVLTNASNYPEPVVPHILGQDVESLANKIVEQVQEAQGE